MYRKLSAQHVFNGYTLLPEGTVLITTADGAVVETVSKENAGDGIEVFNGILCPGFINTHCHLELSHLKGIITEHTGLIDFVFNIITRRNTAHEPIQETIAAAEAAMLKNGIVAVGDICNTTDTVNQKKYNRLHYHNFIELAGFVPATAQSRMDSCLQTQHFFKTNLSVQHTTIAPHAPYSVSPQLFELINNLPANNLLTIHNQETPAEDDFFKTGSGDFLQLYRKLDIDISFYKPSGKSSLQTCLPYFNKKQSLILVHDVTTTKEDIEFIKLSTVNQQLSTCFICLCPNANLYISNTLPNVETLLANNATITLGTDSLASNHQLSILEEMKTLQQHFPQLQITQLLQWATINGAKALQMDSQLGSFESGKKPGVVLIENVNETTLNKQSAVKRLL